ncbi:MAG: gliding motility-associated C-terminal domain-containing protein [Phycisphaerae bacterium]|nr:gliding motility-associated C-terminal domain-containing protein [Saprospiraceae bacterium]
MTEDTTICDGGFATITFNFSGGTGPYSFTLSPFGDLTGIFSGDTRQDNPLNTTTYQITSLEDVNGCPGTSTSTVKVTVLQPPVLGNISGSTPVCQGSIQTYSVLPITGVSSYNWTVPPGASITSGQDSKTVMVNWGTASSGNICVTGTNMCGTGQPSCKNITVNPAPPVSIAVTVLSCTSVQLEATTGGTAYIWSNNATTQTTTVSTSGVYTVTVTFSGGCTASATKTISAGSFLPNASATGGTLNCIQDTVILNGNSNTPGVSFQWSGPNGFSSSLEDPVVNTAGVYTLSVTGSGGCVQTAQCTVTSNLNVPSIAATGGSISCTSNLDTLSATSNVPSSFKWMGPNMVVFTVQNPIVSATGTYTLIVTDSSSGCIATATAVVMADNSIPNVSASGNIVNCIMPTAILNGNSTTPGATYQWNGPNGFSSTLQNPTVQDTGVYSLVVTVPNGCSATALATLTGDFEPPNFQLSASNPISCANTSATLTANAGTPNITYLWTSPTGINASANPWVVTTAGLYTCVGTASNGCTTSQNILVIDDGTIPDVAAFGDTLTCIQDTVILNGQSNTPGVSFQWSGPNGFMASAPNAIANIPGTYNLTVSLAATGCSAQVSVLVVADTSKPIITIAGNSVLSCAMPSVSLSAQSATQLTNLVWTGPTGGLGNAPSIMVSQAGMYSVTGTGINGCSSTTSIAVQSDPSLPSALLSGAGVSCIGGDSIALNIAFSGQAPYTFTYSVNGALQPAITTTSNPHIFKVMPAATTQYQLTAMNTGPCFGSVAGMAEVVYFPGNAIVNISASTSIICKGDAILLTAHTTLPNPTYQWSIGGPNQPALTVYPPNDITYSVTVSASGCSGSAFKNIQVKDRPNVAIDPVDPKICIGMPVMLKASGASTYLWSDNTQNANLTVVPTVTTNYRVIGWLNPLCPDTVFSVVEVCSPPTASAGPDHVVCAKEVMLNASIGSCDVGEWQALDGSSIDNVDNASTMALDLKSGKNRFVWLVTSTTCPGIAFDTLVLTLNNQMPALQSDTTLIIAGSDLENWNLLANDNLGQLPGKTVFIINEDNRGDWSLNALGLLDFEPNLDSIGLALAQYVVCNALCPQFCDTASIRIMVRIPDDDAGGTIAITPNGDGINDVLVFDYLTKYPDNSIVIFNRWGQQVYGSKPYYNDWGGMYNGKPLPAGTYYYILNLVGEDEVVWGNVLIVR